MTTREMIKENNRLREQMTPGNKDYVEDVIVFVRSSRVQQFAAEKRLLELTHAVLEGQSKGKSASQLYGQDRTALAEQIAGELPAVKPVEGLKYYIMIAWIALTWLFLIEALVGFVAIWSGYTGASLNRISLLTMIMIALGSILLVEVLMKSINRSQVGHGNPKSKIDLKAIGAYILVLVVIMGIGYSLRNILPVFTVSPWVSLIIFIVGLAGQKFIFMRGR